MQLNVIQKYFTPTSVLDIGANVGDFAKQCKLMYPMAKYFLIEGNDACEPYLKNLGYEYFIGLLSDTPKLVKFYINKQNHISTGNSIYRENTEHFSDENVIIQELQTTTLDRVVDNRKFDLIKIDVQGSELDIIRGGLNTVKNAKGIIMELSIIEYNKDSSLQEEVIEYMASIDYHPVEELYAHTNSEGLILQRDVLFLNRSYHGV